MLKPLGDCVVVELVETVETTTSGIILPGSSEEQPQEGVVISVGVGRRLTDGTVATIAVEKGQRIIFEKYTGTEVTHQGQNLLIVKERDILAIIE